MEKDRSPGCDGIPLEFYRTFWSLLGKSITYVANEIMADGQMTDTQKTVIVRLIPKKGDLKLLANWRPISLLCVNNKVIAKVVASRLKPLLDRIIVTEQTGGMEVRDVADNLSCFWNVIEYHTTMTDERPKSKKERLSLASTSKRLSTESIALSCTT